MSWIIQDWAGNVLFNGQTFPSFDDGWEHIYLAFPDESEDFYGEYYVVPVAEVQS